MIEQDEKKSKEFEQETADEHLIAKEEQPQDSAVEQHQSMDEQQNFWQRIKNKGKSLCRSLFSAHALLREGIKIILGLLFSLDYYYYLSDRGLPKVAALVIVGLFWYIVFTLFIWCIQAIVYLLKKIPTKSLASYVALGAGIYYFLPKLMDEDNFAHWEMRGITALVVIIIFFFLQSLRFFLKRKTKWSIFPLFLWGSCFCGGIFFLLFPGLNHMDLSYLPKEEAQYTLASEAKYEVVREDYQAQYGTNLLSYVSYQGLKKEVRDRYFRRGLNDVPLRGEIYLPKGQSNVPVLFIVHGNHRFTTESYRGYDYLGQYLASRGIAVVSVDMNMLNGFMKFGLSNENDARGILLLKNMNYILKESSYKDVLNAQKIALAGHSRGGEAVTLAYLYNELPLDPDNGTISFHYHFHIKGLIGIAPTYGQYNPSDKNVVLKNVNYLTLAGACDSDVTSFEGMNQYNSVLFDDNTDHFKAALYIGNANHGQFNSLWKSYDSDPPEGLNINRSILLSQKKQEKITQMAIYSFLGNTFGLSNDRGFFQREPYAYAGFPKTPYYSCYQDSSYVNLCNYEEDMNLRTTSRPQDRISFANLKDIYEQSVANGEDDSNSTGVFLDTKKGSSYQIFLGENPPLRKYFTFDIQNQNTPSNQPLNIQLMVTDTMGNSAELSTREYAFLTPITRLELTKTDSLLGQSQSRASLQTVRIPLEDFTAKNPQLKISEISKIEFQTGERMGKFILDNIGFTD